MRFRESTTRRIREQAELLTFLIFPMLVVVGESGFGRALGWLAGLAVVAARRPVAVPNRLWILAAASGTIGSMIGPVWFRGTAFHAGLVGLSLVGLAIVVAGERVSARSAMAIAGGASLVVLIWSVLNDPGGVLDVTLMHRAGSDALSAGVSPWEGLAVRSGAPGMEGTVITGDPYPPIALITYWIGDRITGDPRAAGALAWLILIGSTMALRVKNHLPAVVLLTSGALPLLLWTGWTELLTISLVVGAVALWRSPLAASAVLGAALASKQYMIIALPLISTMVSNPVRLRRIAALLVASILALAGFAFGAGYLDATVFAYREFPARYDSSSLYGFVTIFVSSFDIPFWLGPVAAFAVAIRLAMKRVIAGPDQLLEASAISLSVLFLLGTQAFSNYWFLVWALVLTARTIVDLPADPTPRRDGPASLPSQEPPRSPARP